MLKLHASISNRNIRIGTFDPWVIDVSPVSPTHINKDKKISVRDIQKTLDYKKRIIVLNGGIERMELKKLKKQGKMKGLSGQALTDLPHGVDLRFGTQES